MSTRILIVEDELAIAESVEYALKAEDFEVEIAADGLEGLNKFKDFVPDLIILDLMMPKLSGIDVCRVIRKESQVPIIMLTAKVEELDKILGLELGADDYVTKPFSIRELLARIRVILRRYTAQPNTPEQITIRCGDLLLDISRRSLIINDEKIHLPLKQFELLKTLMSNNGVVVKREELFEAVWGPDVTYDSGTLDVHMRWLREKVEPQPSKPVYVKTVRGVGYKIGNV